MKTRFLFSILILVFTLAVAQAQDATRLFEEGVALKTDKKISEAVGKFRQAIALNPDYTDAHYELGWCLNDLKQYPEAITSLRKARKTWFDVPKVYFELGYAFDKSSMTDSAYACYHYCLKLKPDYSLAYKQLGTLEYNSNNYEQALEYFEQYETYTKLEIKDYLYWYRKGYMLNAQKEYSSAIEALQNSLKYFKQYANTYLELGFACARLKQTDDAIKWYQQAIQLDPRSHVGYNGIGEVYRDYLKDCDQAISWYRKSLEINPTERKACFGIGYCLNSQSKYEEAIGFLEKAIASEPDYVAAFVEIGYSHYMLKRYDLALEKLNKAMSLSTSNQNARYYAGLVYISQGNKAMAQKMLDELKALNSKLAATLEPKIAAM